MNTLKAGAGSDTLASAVSALADGWTAPKTQRASCRKHASDSSPQSIASRRNADEAALSSYSAPVCSIIRDFTNND